MAHDVFVSYPSEDKLTADAVVAELERRGVRCWVAPRDVPAGKGWAGSIVEAISGAQTMVLIFSAATNNSQHILREVREAAEAELTIVPFRTTSEEPTPELRYYIGGTHWLDALTESLARHVEDLAIRVSADLADSAVEVEAPIGGRGPSPSATCPKCSGEVSDATAPCRHCGHLLGSTEPHHGTADRDDITDIALRPPSGQRGPVSPRVMIAVGLLLVGAIVGATAIFGGGSPPALSESQPDASQSPSDTSQSQPSTSTVVSTTSGLDTELVTSNSATAVQFSTALREGYLAGCEAESPGGGFCACTLDEMERRLTEDEFIAFAIDSLEEPPPEFLEIAFACAGELGSLDSSLATFSLQVGDCFNDDAVAGGSVSELPLTPCAEPHDNEIFYEYSMTESVFPGSMEALTSASIRCLEEFKVFVGISFVDSVLTTFPVTPTAQSWAQGDRVVYCVLYAVDLSKLTGSMRGARL
jgi:hypothetical protein